MGRRFKLILLVATILLIAACSNSADIERFTTKEEALENFMKDGDIKGSIDLITTLKNDKLLVTQPRENTYFIGEFKEDKDQFYAARISDNVQMEIGASWELTTMDGNEYTIFFEKTKEESDYIQLPNEAYYIAVVEGHKLDESSALTNVIEDLEIVKE